MSLPQTPSVGLASVSESQHDCRMIAIALLFVRFLCDCFKSRRRLEAEILVLRHQLNVLHRRAPRRLYMTWADRALFAWLYRGLPCILEALAYRPCKRSCDIKCLLSHRKQLPGIRQCRHAPSRRCPEGQAWRRTQVSRNARFHLYCRKSRNLCRGQRCRTRSDNKSIAVSHGKAR